MEVATGGWCGVACEGEGVVVVVCVFVCVYVCVCVCLCVFVCVCVSQSSAKM